MLPVRRSTSLLIQPCLIPFLHCSTLLTHAQLVQKILLCKAVFYISASVRTAAAQGHSVPDAGCCIYVRDHKVSLSCFLQPFRILLNYCWTLEHIEWILVHLLSSTGFLRVFPLSQVVNKDTRQCCPQYQAPRSSISNQSPVSFGLELVLISFSKDTCWSVSVTPTLFMKQNPDAVNFIACGTHCSSPGL